ncbi:MAG: DPP IV N-terminal domain-containing protein [Gemmatimonadales bacterium]
MIAQVVRPLGAIAMLGAALASPGAAQPRGVELFGAMLSGQLSRTTGTTRLRWLPGTAGYLEIAVDSATGTRSFSRVDPRTERRRPLFDGRTVARIAEAYRRETGGAAAGLPFADLAFEPGGEAFQFTADGAQWLYRLTDHSLRRLRVPERTGPLNLDATEPGVFSPDYRRYAFVRDYDNLFLFDVETGEERPLTTGTGEDNTVGFLGAGPWYRWSPDGRRIAFLKADQQSMPEYPILFSREPVARVERMRYPFTTTPTPSIEVWVVDVETGASRRFATNSEALPFVRELTWLPDGSGLVYHLVDRWESRLEVRLVELASGLTRTLAIDEDPAYLDPPHNFQLLQGGARFLLSSERSGRRQLYLHDVGGREPRQLTDAEWATGEVLHVDEGSGWVYLVGYPNSGLDTHLYRVRLDGTGWSDLTPEPGVHRVSIDPTGSYFTDDHSSIETPRTVTLRRTDGGVVRTLATTNVDAVAAVGLTAPEILALRTADGQSTMHAILHRPVDLDPTRKYPVVVMVYGGPHTKAVRNAYQTLDFDAQLAQLGFLVMEIDGRGTRLREKRYQTATYLRLGQEDVDDQAAGVRQLAARFPYVDASRVGVTGLSHGGYMTLMMKLRYPDVFQVGVAGAPMTDVALGPRQYIGRMMRTPDANPEGYEKANVLNYADRMQGRLMIYHGTNDRNAVIGHTMLLVGKLVDLGKPVDLMIYPDGVHVLEGEDMIHQVKTAVSYFLEHLRPEGWEASRAAIWSLGS